MVTSMTWSWIKSVLYWSSCRDIILQKDWDCRSQCCRRVPGHTEARGQLQGDKENHRSERKRRFSCASLLASLPGTMLGNDK